MSDFLADSREDWTDENLTVLRELIRVAYQTAAQGIREYHPALAGNPNRLYAQGYMRWVILDGLLHRACADGRLPGITAVFRSNKSGPDSLELIGRKTKTLVVHLSKPDEPPRGSDLREQARECNQALFSFMREPGSGEKAVQLLLVHAGEKYAGLRIYYDLENPSHYHPVTENIMATKLPAHVFDTEAVTEVDPALAVIPAREDAAWPVAN